MFLGVIMVTAIGQVTDSTSVVTYDFGDSLVEFLKSNMWTLIFMVLYLVSEWIGESGAIPEGSVWRKILNWVLEFVRKKATVSPKMKRINGYYNSTAKVTRNNFAGNAFKVLIFALVLSGLSLTGSAQDPWKGFFKPVDKDMFSLKTAGEASSSWLFRPTVELSALQLTYNKETKGFDASSLTQAGVGIGYQHFTQVNGEPYNNFGLNLLMLFDAVPLETTGTAISGAITVSALQFINIGGGYNFGLKRPFILTAITYNFN